ncbi:MAG: hypothetical protein K0S37_753 [Microbacterium sp.]|jgi:hypothetical protein|nr:hypothetical protein [Microbacterium sp.]
MAEATVALLEDGLWREGAVTAVRKYLEAAIVDAEREIAALGDRVDGDAVFGRNRRHDRISIYRAALLALPKMAL